MSIYEPHHTPAKNKDDAKHAFYAREEYKIMSLADVRAGTAPRYIDFWHRKPLYGKIDRRGNAVANLQNSSLKAIVGSQSLFAIDFVADAFEDFRDYYISLIANRQLPPTVGDLADISAVNAWENVEGLYQSHLDEMKEYFIKTYLVPNTDKIVDAKDVFRLYEKFMFNHARDFPITFTGFIYSSKCPRRVSGLIIELIGGSHGDDSKKASMLGSFAFEKYASAAARYGFFIDKNAPWSLVANLGSPAMRDYMRPYGLEQPRNYFKEYCYMAHRSGLDKMREFIYDCYYAFFTNNPFRQRTTICKTVKKETIKRKILTIEGIDNTIPISYWFNLYMMSRYYEVNIQLNATTIRQFQHKVSVLNRMFGPQSALDHINEYLRNLFFHTSDRPIAIPMKLFSMTPTAADPAMVTPHYSEIIVPEPVPDPGDIQEPPDPFENVGARGVLVGSQANTAPTEPIGMYQ
jgi:hypothetical protein